MQPFKHELGKQAEDKITKMKGIITARAEHLFGCNTYGIAPEVLENGKRLDTEWFDEGRLKIIGEGIDPKEVKVDDDGPEFGQDHPKLK